MENINFNISYPSVIWFIGLGVGVFLLFRFIKRLVYFWIPNRQNRHLKFERLLPVIEGVVWFAWVIWGVQGVFNSKGLYTIIILLIIVIVLIAMSRFAIRDFIAGVILKLEGAFNIGERIKIRDVEGRVKELGYFGVKLENFQGEIITLPYSSVSGVKRILSKSSDKIKNHTFTLQLPKKYAVTETIEKAKSTILNTPWASITQKPHIKLLDENGEAYTFEVIVYSLHQRYFQKLQTHLQTWGQKL
ncbi:MAG TPA: hypothetical protein DCS93_01315 [Microscillaceae bacterium]|nr:hypothetical protein [Microscillaceae bacterium]